MTPDSTPSATLATKIVDALLAESLIPVSKRKDLIAKLGTGRVTPQEWRLLLEIALPKPDRESADATSN
jgi:hypothetical protein